MSTRSVIARKTANGFTGVYHHWDGYPTGLGATLFEIRNGHFKGSTAKMLEFLIDAHPAGWSTINGADFTLEPGFKRDGEQPCEVCKCPQWMHYTQYYASHQLPTPPSFDGRSYQVFNHGYKEPELPHGPECYCHGGRNEEANEVTQANASGMGCEWAYVFDGDQMHILSSYRGDGSGKMIGMFGCGDDNASWFKVATVDLDAGDVDWDEIENAQPVIPN